MTQVTEFTNGSDDKYLLDECAQIDSTLAEKYNYTQSRDIIGIGAKDEVVLNVAIKKQFVLITGDKRLALHAILHNQKVVFQYCKTKHRVIIEPKLTEYYDPISQYILQRDIVAP